MFHIKDKLQFKAILPWVLLVLLFSMGPYLVAWLLTPPGKVFHGTLANHNDFTAYIAAMRQGAEGKWLFHFNFSPEAWQPRLMLPMYMLAGKLIDPFGGSRIFWFHVLRGLVFSTTLVALLYWVRQVLPDEKQQLTAWIFIVFGGGVGWMLWPIAGVLPLPPNSFPDITIPEWMIISVSVNPPHYMLGLGLETILLICVARMVRAANGLKWAGIGAVVALGLGLVYVYHSAVAGFIIGAYMLSLAWQERRIPWRQWGYGAIVITPLLPLLFYYGYWVNLDPFWATYANGELNHLPAPPITGLVIGLGLLALFAVVGIRNWFRTKQDWLVPIWLISNLLLMYVPIVQYSGRFVLGLMVPVATLAAHGLEEVVLPWLQSTSFFTRFSRLTPTPHASLRHMIILLTTPSTLMVTLFLVKNVMLQKELPYYMPASELQAAAWLAENTDEHDIILTDYPVGNYLPSIANSRVFLGQLFLTTDLHGKMDQLKQFWDANTPSSWRQDFLHEWDISYIYQGQYERELMKGEVQPLGQIVYQADGITIYRVHKP